MSRQIVITLPEWTEIKQIDNKQFADLLPAYDEMLNMIKNGTLLPKGQWLRISDLSEQEDDRYKCSRCGNVIHHKDKMNLYTFNSWCGRCGSDNGSKIEDILNKYKTESEEAE